MQVAWFSVGIWRKKKACTAAANAVGPHPNGLASVESATNGTPWKSPAPLLPFRVPLLHSRLVSLLSPSMTSVLSKRAPNQPESASSTAFSVGALFPELSSFLPVNPGLESPLFFWTLLRPAPRTHRFCTSPAKSLPRRSGAAQNVLVPYTHSFSLRMRHRFPRLLAKLMRPTPLWSSLTRFRLFNPTSSMAVPVALLRFALLQQLSFALRRNAQSPFSL